MRSRWVSGVREAARQMSRMRSGFVSVLRRERAARDFCFVESGVVESGFRIEEKWRSAAEERGDARRSLKIYAIALFGEIAHRVLVYTACSQC